MQNLIVTLIVIACATYAAWSLAPAALRRRLSASMRRLPMPTRLAAFFEKHAAAASGCGCDGCDRGTKGAAAAKAAAVPAAQPITFQRRIKSGPVPR